MEQSASSQVKGEGIELTLPSYCLDADKAGPSENEFYSIERISGKQAEWLKPLLDYASRHPDEDLPVQSLIWNMGKGISYEDFPEDQQVLLSAAVPDAEKCYRKKLGKRLLGRLVEEVRSRVDVITDFESVAERINSRRSKLKLILPKYNTFRLESGILVKVKSTGIFSKLTLIIVNPREEHEEKRLPAKTFFLGGLGFGPGIGPSFLPRAHELREPFPFFPSQGQSRWGRARNWWNDNKGKIDDWSTRASDVKDIIDS